MKRFLYLLLAASIGGIAPQPLPAEAVERDDVEETSSATPSGERARSAGRIAVVDAPQEDGPDPAPRLPSETPALLVEHDDASEVSAVGVGRTLHGNDHDATCQLVHAVLRDATSRGDLKVQIDGDVLPLPELLSVSSDHRFTYWRTVTRREHHVHEFFADLYSAQRE